MSDSHNFWYSIKTAQIITIRAGQTYPTRIFAAQDRYSYVPFAGFDSDILLLTFSAGGCQPYTSPGLALGPCFVKQLLGPHRRPSCFIPHGYSHTESSLPVRGHFAGSLSRWPVMISHRPPVGCRRCILTLKFS